MSLTCEDFLPRDAGFTDRGATLILVFVHLRTIDLPCKKLFSAEAGAWDVVMRTYIQP